jgi:hypothetical protein
MTRPLILAALLTLAGACAPADKQILLHPADVDFKYGESVEMAKQMQAMPTDVDPTKPVEGLHGAYVEGAMNTFKDSTKPVESKEDEQQLQLLLMEPNK